MVLAFFLLINVAAIRLAALPSYHDLPVGNARLAP